VQSSHFIEDRGEDTSHKVTFYGQEKTATTIRLANMNLAVHGLEGDIREANTFYEDMHSLYGQCDFVMANPPFNIDVLQPKRIEEDRAMMDKTLFLAWQDKRMTRGWFPIGRLDVLSDQAAYRFRYTKGAERAHERAGFEALLDFPKWDRAYESSELFPLFKNRVISANRRDLAEYLKMLDLPVTAEPAEILEVGGGYRATDSFEVFPRIVRRPDGFFSCRFFLHGWRHVNAAAQRRIEALTPGEPLYVTIELTNPATQLAVQLQTQDYYMIGWTPRYLVNDLARAIALSPGEYGAKIVRINPAPAPSKQRLLVELEGRWPDYEPMTAGDFEPLVH
jgi:hypothetical protein